MKIDEIKKVSLQSKYFQIMRTDLDQYIQAAIRNLDEKKLSGATIGLKIDLSIMKNKVEDENAPTGVRDSVRPSIKYRIGLTLQSKASRNGDVTNYDTELVQDDTGAYFMLTKDEASGQLNMFNSYDELPQDADMEDAEDAGDDPFGDAPEADDGDEGDTDAEDLFDGDGEDA